VRIELALAVTLLADSMGQSLSAGMVVELSPDKQVLKDIADITSSNTCLLQLLRRIGGAETIRSTLMGMFKPKHILHRGAEVEEIVNMAAIAVSLGRHNRPGAG
jgi:hypothetical protein